MSHKKMFGFVDPITLGFLIALGGTALGFTQGKPADKPIAVRAADSKARTPAPASVSIVRVEGAGTR